MDAALHNAVDDRDGSAIPVKSSISVKSSKADKISTRQLKLQKP